MAKVTANYETIFILDLSQGEEKVAELFEKFKGIIEKNATLGEIEEWGKRRLAYPIDDMNDGHYVLINFTSVPEFPQELDRQFRITEGVMRSIIVCKDE